METGDSDDSYIEITSGLTEDDTVAYAAASSSGGEDMAQMGLFGMGGSMPGGGAPGGGMPGGGGPGGGFPGCGRG